jgi:serine/threonine kinase 3
MEYCDGGSVAGMMNKMGAPLNEEQIQVVLEHTIRGLVYLHSSKKIHRDIKADNILANIRGEAKLG